jgi:two-component system cell cycle sensor histidine kinase PleC
VLLLLAAALTAVGALLPHLDSHLMSTLLFGAGAGLAALVVILPWQIVTRSESDASMPRRSGSNAKAPAPNEPSRQVRFPELLVATGAEKNIDRAAWAKLTAHMSHELRTPLNAVLGFSELMAKEVFGPLGSGYDSYARDIHTSGRNLLKTAEDALAITALLTASECTRAGATSRINSVVEDACAFATPDLALRSITLDVGHLRDDEVMGDHQAMRQMLINLIAEAGRNAASGATLRIDANPAPEAIGLSLTLKTDGPGAAAEDGFPIILARTLCELSGAELTIGGSPESGEWTWTVRLARAVQADLFAAA